MTTDVGRRRALQIVALGTVAIVGGGVGAWRSLGAPMSSPLEARSGQPLREPPTLASRAGILEVALTAAPGVVVAGRRTSALGYNGTTPGPTLRVAPGDVLRLTLANELDQTTNLHTHGLHVSPEGNGDNVFRMVEPGERATYEYVVPADHPTGTFWYHPHHHGTVADQVFGGLFGALLVAAPSESAAGAARERVLVVSDTTLTSDGAVAAVSARDVMAGREGELLLVNGQLRPRIDCTEGVPERWRVVNACTSRFVELRLDDHPVGFVGYDGHALDVPEARSTVVLAPGNRADLVVEPTRSGLFTLRTLAHDRGGMGMMNGPGPGHLGADDPGDGARRRPGTRPAPGSLAAPSVAPSTCAPWPSTAAPASPSPWAWAGDGDGAAGGMTFTFDGRTSTPTATTRRWRRRRRGMDRRQHRPDGPPLPPARVAVQASRAPATAPASPTGRTSCSSRPGAGAAAHPVHDAAGRSVYHCHILDHEDPGMMGTIEVRPTVG